jgi:glycosyltransferase involved in cell wall biosynthesis
MDAHERRPRGIIALLPFLVKGALSLSVLRAMRERGLDVTLADHALEAGGYTLDPAVDFKADDRLLDLSEMATELYLKSLGAVIEARDVGLVLQIGAPGAYRNLPYLKERHSGLRVVDTLYNEIGHTVDHFLYEACMDGVIVESEHMRRFVEQRSAKTEPNVVLVQSGIDLAYHAPRPVGPPREGLVLGYIGRMSPEKNPLGFIDIAQRLASGHPALSFVMYGEGGMSDDVKARIAAAGLGSRLRFEGYVQDLQEALTLIDALVVPSVTDGRPNIIMEANAFARPVLAAPVGGIPELIENGRNGYLVSPNDFAALSAIVRSWESDPTALAALSASSHEIALARFDRRRMLDKYEAAFRSFLCH